MSGVISVSLMGHLFLYGFDNVYDIHAFETEIESVCCPTHLIFCVLGFYNSSFCFSTIKQFFVAYLAWRFFQFYGSIF